LKRTEKLSHGTVSSLQDSLPSPLNGPSGVPCLKLLARILKQGIEDQEDRMNRAEIKAVIRHEKPDPAGFGLPKSGNVKFFIDKAFGILYPAHFICDGPTLRG